MPRSPRIEYENAIYHIMARGNRREPIVFGDEDRETFVKTLAQVCEKTGWEVFAWVLRDNHYHLALRTPEPNLVEGREKSTLDYEWSSLSYGCGKPHGKS